MLPYSPKVVSDTERLHLLRLARTENVGPISFAHLLQRYGTAEEALNRLPDIARRSGAKIPSMDDIRREVDAHTKQGLHLLCQHDAAYPAGLRSMKDAPPFISVAGRLDVLQKTLFSIVGARHASQAGERIATQISEQISAKSWVLVSGLARGIDACVHAASVDSGGTIAVIAGGIGHIYPPEHKKLYTEIAEKGAIISEDSLFTGPHAGLFPKRNRIISGLSWGSLIVEASLRSGSLLTAKYAADQGRTVLAIPGHPLDFRARGANKLLKQGACLVETAEDIFFEYASSHTYMPHVAQEEASDGYCAMPALLPESSTLSRDIYALLGVVPTSVSDLSEKLGLSGVMIRIALIEMELNGEIERCPGDAVVRCV